MLDAVGHNWISAFLICLGIMVLGVLFQFFSLQSYRRGQRK
jgi:hypothetical protein